MKAKLLLVTVFLACGFSVFAQPWAKARLEASSRHGEWVDVTNGARVVRCFLVYPEVKDPAPAVVVIHEIFGLTDWARNAADEVAAAGCIAIAPDLLSGLGPKGGGSSDFASIDDVRGAISKLPGDQVMGDLNAAADYVKKLPAANGKLAVAGFCWGGGKSFAFATDRPDLSAAFVFYGPPPAVEEMARIKCPVYGFYAGNDARISSTIPKTESEMKAADKTYKPVKYDGAGHGFMRMGEQPDASQPNKEAHDKAWQRFKKLLAKL
ncbi:MAG TPA: dienelactone hydrolase family protein [Candidatus Saccharimonadales bacterium]|nr:dienelactone hydrolase family protein [Candidatus Saccharimonadales bacterium]